VKQTAGPQPDRLAARVGAVAVYATSAQLAAHRRTKSERAMRTLLTVVGSWLAAPLGFLIPPHLEPAVVVLLAGLYFARRAWVGEWQVAEMSGTCPRCSHALHIKTGSMLYLPHSLTCPGCKAECWLELGEAPVIDEAVRVDAMERAVEKPRAALDGQPPATWSPAASDWRDRRRD
jgi:hypothetical protein